MLPNLLMDITDFNAQFFMICNNKKCFQNHICFLNRRNFLKEIRAITALIDIYFLNSKTMNQLDHLTKDIMLYIVKISQKYFETD